MQDQHLKNFFTLEKKQTLREGYMSGRKNINPTMRSAIVNWLYEILIENVIQRETIFLAIAILDRYICISTNIDKNNFSLVGITCVWIASKFIETTWFSIETCLEFCCNKYIRSDMELMEIEILTKLQWDINFTTSYHFLKIFKQKFGLTKKEYRFCKYLLEFVQHHSVLMHYMPSTLATTVICTMVTMNVTSNVDSVSDFEKEKTWNFYISKTKILEATKQDASTIEECCGKLNILLLKEMILVFNKKENNIKSVTQHYHDETNDGPSDKVYLWYNANDNLDDYECE